MYTISPDDLMNVTGGKDKTPTVNSNNNNDQVMTALQSIQSTLKDLGKPNNQGLFSGQNGLMFMMALCMSRRSEVVVIGGGRRGFWRSC